MNLKKLNKMLSFCLNEEETEDNKKNQNYLKNLDGTLQVKKVLKALLKDSFGIQENLMNYKIC